MSDTIGRYNVILELITESKKTNEGVNSIKQNVGGLSTLFKTAAAGFAGIFSVQAIQGINSKIFEITKKYQQYATILKVATGSQQAAAQTMKLIEDTARETTFSVDELTSSYIMMINRGFKPTKQEIIAIADLAASQGRSFADLTQAMLNATTGEYEMLKGFGIKVSSVGDKLNLSFKGMNQTIEKTPEAMQKAILALGQMKGVAGSNAEQMNTLNGILSNMGDNAEKIWKNIGERLKKFYTESLSGVAKMVEWISKLTEIDLADKYREEQVELNGLVMRITDVNTKTEDREKLMISLNEKYPFFLANIKEESRTNGNLIKRLQVVNDLYLLRIKFQQQQGKIDDAAKETSEKQIEADKELSKRYELLSKIALQFELPFDPVKLGNYKKATDLVLKELQKMFQLEATENGMRVKGNQAAYDSYNKLLQIRGNFIRESTKAKELKKGYEEEVNLLKFMEQQAGKTREEVEKLFDAGTTTDKPTPKGGTGTGKGTKTKEQIEKERQQKMLDDLEKYYLQKELAAKKEITDAEKLSNKLQEIEYEKNLALLRLKRIFAKDNTKEATELEIQILDTENAFLDFMYGLANKVPEAANISSTWQKQAKSLSGLKEELDLLVSSLSKLDGLGPKARAFVDVLTGVSNDKAKTAQEKNLHDIANRIKKSNPELFPEEDEEEDTRGLIARMLGISKEQEKLYIDGLQSLKGALMDYYDVEIRKIDELIDKQQERYDKAKQLAEKGKVEQLNIEEARLNALTEKRDKFEKQQRAIAAMQIVTAQSVAAAEAIKGAVQSFANKPGIVGIVEGTAYLLALGAAILSIRNSVSSAFSDIPGYAEGINAYGVSDNGLVAGKGTGKSDSNLAKLSKGERVVPEEVNKQIGYDFPNAKLPEAIHAYRILPSVLNEIRSREHNSKQLDELKKEMVAVRQSIESIKIVTKLDKDGFIQNIERSFDEAIRRKKIMG